MSIAIRPATSADVARCAEIYRPFATESWMSFETEPPDADEMVARFATYGASHGWLVAHGPDGRIACYAYVSPHRPPASQPSSHDVAVYVDPAQARRGIGRALYGALLPLLRDRGIHAAFAGIALPNAGSIGLHEAMGFTPVGIYREVGWKLGAWRDVGWWQRVL